MLDLEGSPDCTAASVITANPAGVELWGKAPSRSRAPDADESGCSIRKFARITAATPGRVRVFVRA